jgi:hypothetical protein
MDAGNDLLLSASKDMHLDANDSLVFRNLNALNKMFSNGDIDIRGKDITINASGTLITKGSNIPEN